MSRPHIVEAFSASPQGSATQLPDVVCGHTVFLVSPTTPETIGQWVILPDNCEIGDVVEIQTRPRTEGFGMLLPAGDTWVSGNNPSAMEGAVCRKVSATEWTGE